MIHEEREWIHNKDPYHAIDHQCIHLEFRVSGEYNPRGGGWHVKFQVSKFFNPSNYNFWLNFSISCQQEMDGTWSFFTIHEKKNV